MKKLDDKLTGFIYEYVRKDNGEVVYRGSSEHVDNKYGTALENVDQWHRQGERFKAKFKYSYTVFRSNLRRPFGENVEIKFLTEPKEMTRKELLALEGEKIQEMHDKGQCILNHDSNPLETWKKYN
jgi:hypothetical protein